MKFQWQSLLALVPAIVLGIQQVRADAKGSTKKQIVLESLGLATAVADQVLAPEQKAIADAVSQSIDATVALFHATNAPGFGTNSLPPAPDPTTPPAGGIPQAG